MDIIISNHAVTEIKRRNIHTQDIEQVLKDPQQILPVRPGRQIYQSIITMNSKPYLLRLIMDDGDDGNPPILVTVYRTSKIQKYWRGQ